MIKLIATLLKSRILNGGNLEPTLEGAPQGSPLSPLLSNIVLDELDKELEQRGLLFCRFADDAKIYVGSHRAGARVMKSVCRFIERKLKFVVNKDKSQIGKVSRIHFLGFVVLPTQLKI
ncbi:MAG: hypothetical protein GXY61_03770 [Lentisphaerae bacterium]|nr:hypothetical protein [Lentisphaerota bacterium]